MARKEAVYKVKVDTGQAVKDVKALDGDMRHLGETIGVEVSASISAMEDKLYDLALAGQVNTDEFKKLQEQTARYKQIIIETDRSIDALAEQGKGLSTALSLASGTVAGFQAFTGVTALLGDENEDLLRTITQLQAAQGVLSSIEVIKQQLQINSIKIQRAQTLATKAYNFAVGEGTILEKAKTVATLAGAGAMRILNAVMNLNPVFLLITGVVALVGALAIFGDSAESAAESNEKLNKTLERERDLIDETLAKIRKKNEQRLELLKVEGASEEALHNERLRQLKVEEGARKIQIDQELSDIERKQVTYKKALEEEDFELAKTIRSEISQSRKRYKELILQNGDYQIALKKENAEFAKQQEDEREKQTAADKAENDKRLHNYKKFLDERRNAERLITDLQLELLQDNEFKEIEILNETFRRKIEDTKRDESKNQEEKEKIIRLFERNRQKIENEIRAKFIEDEVKNVEDLGQALPPLPAIDLGVEFNEEDFIVKVDSLAERIQLSAIKLNEKVKELTGQTINEIGDSMQTSIGSLQTFSDNVFDIFQNKAKRDGKESESIARRQFQVTKALQIAQATIQGIQGVQSAFASAQASPITKVFPAYPFVQAAAAGAFAIANVAKIKSTNFESAGGGIGATSGASAGASSGSFTIGDSLNTDQTNLNPDGTQQGSQPIQVVVTESDITNTQNNVQKILKASTF